MQVDIAWPFFRFSTEIQKAIEAAVKNTQDYRYFVECIDGPIKGWTIWLCSQRKQKWPAFCHYTVEDHGTRYRVRGDGRYDRWRTVRK